jgi:DNA-binding GntR family transcriptional regulator
MMESRTLAHEIAHRVRGLIEDGAYEPGDPVRQEDVARRLSVSRIPVREAFRLLEAEGLLVVHANRGAFVHRPSIEEVEELFDVRLMLESDLLQRACQLWKPPLIDRVEAVDALLAATSDREEWVRLDEEFHFAIDFAAGRPQTLALALTLRRSLNGYYRRFLGPDVRPGHWRREHRDLVKSLRKRDAVRAASVLERHLVETRKVLVAAMGGAIRNQGRVS